jgi:hypothetical protein
MFSCMKNFEDLSESSVEEPVYFRAAPYTTPIIFSYNFT